MRTKSCQPIDRSRSCSDRLAGSGACRIRPVPAVRILLDYRPALRAADRRRRVRARAGPRAGRHRRPPANRSRCSRRPGRTASIGDGRARAPHHRPARAGPRPELRLASARLAARRAAGRRGLRRRAVAPSAADPGARRRAGRDHRTISIFSTIPNARAPRSGATTPRWPRRTPGGPTRSSPSRSTTADDVERRLGVPGDRVSRSATRARPRGRAATTEPRRRAACCSSARSSRERISACCSTPTSGSSRDDASGAAARARRPRSPAPRPTLVGARAGGRRSPAGSSCPATSTRRPARALFTARAGRSCMPSHTEGFGMPVLEAHDRRRAGDRRQPRRAARSRRRRRVPLRAGRRRGVGGSCCDDLLTDSARRDRMRDAGWEQAARVQLGATPRAAVREAWDAGRRTRRARRG